MAARTVLFVSKPICPPFRDGAKCLVRDVALHLRRTDPIVLTTRAAPPLEARAPFRPVALERLYPGPGAYAPPLADNARVLGRLLFGKRADLWHFVFAPNPASSRAGRVARAARRVPVVQTVASAPRSFAGVDRLLFGDRVVALSRWTYDRLVAGRADPKRLTVIPPSVAPLAPPAPEHLARVRDALGLGDGALVVYPGDIEMSQGAPLLAAAAPQIFARTRDAVLVFACRKKTPRAEEAEARLRADLAPFGARVRFVGEVASLPDLLAAASVVAFPVDDLYGKVDLPIALLEAMALGAPVVALDEGPLRELDAPLFTPPGDARALAEACVRLLADEGLRREIGQKAQELVASRYRPEQVAERYEAVYDDLARVFRR